MRKKVVGILLLTGLVAAAVGMPSTGALAAKAKKPVVVGTDPDDDWGAAVDPTLQPVGDSLGQELRGASISYDGKNVNFIIHLTSLPPSGGIPEFSRYSWDFTVDGVEYDLDGKFTNYSRGACDPTSGQCNPQSGKMPRDPGMQPFLVRGNCKADSSLPVTMTWCEEFAKVQGIFDPAGATITVPVPASAIKVKKGSKIGPAPGTFGGSISAAPAAFVTMSSMPMDVLTVTKTFVVK